MRNVQFSEHWMFKCFLPFLPVYEFFMRVLQSIPLILVCRIQIPIDPSLAENSSHEKKKQSLKTTWAIMEERNLSSHSQLFNFCAYFHYKTGGFNTEMKIPFLCSVYSAFSHIRCCSVSNLPPIFTIFPDASSLEPAIDCRWKGRQKEEDGNEAEGRDKGSPQGLWPPLGTCFAVGLRWPPRPQLPVEKMCQRMFWVSHGKRPYLSR